MRSIKWSITWGSPWVFLWVTGLTVFIGYKYGIGAAVLASLAQFRVKFE